MPSLSGVALSPGEFPPIDDLPNATTPLAGSEFAPISQGGVDKKVTIDNLTAGRSVSVATLVSSAGTALLPAVTTTGDLDTGMWFPAANNIAWSTNALERMRIDSSGNVGIGTASPSVKLDIIGNFSISTDAPYITMAPSGWGAPAYLQSGVSDTGVSIGDNVALFIPSGRSFVFGRLSTSPFLKINDSGNVGIGTASPAFKLDVAGTLNVNADIKVAANSRIGRINETYNGYSIPYNASTGYYDIHSTFPTGGVAFYTGSGDLERMRIDSSGNVGIGTSSPSALLDVRGNGFCNNPNSGYTTTATAAGTTTLTSSSLRQQYFTGTTTQTVVLPVTSTLALGWQFEICNNSTGDVTVQSSGANTIRVLGANTRIVVTCILTSGTGVASWSFTHSSAADGATDVNNQTGTTYTLALTDIGGTVTFSNASAITFTLPQTSSVAIPIGSRIKVINLGAGAVTIVKEGAETLLGNTLLAQYATAMIEKISATSWQVFGGTAVVNEVINFDFSGAILNQAYDIAVRMPFAGTILGLTSRVTSLGTAGNYTVAISGVNVTGLTAITNTTARTNTAATAANTFVAGDYITLTMASTVTVVDCFGSLEYTRTY